MVHSSGPDLSASARAQCRSQGCLFLVLSARRRNSSRCLDTNKLSICIPSNCFSTESAAEPICKLCVASSNTLRICWIVDNEHNAGSWSNSPTCVRVLFAAVITDHVCRKSRLRWARSNVRALVGICNKSIVGAMASPLDFPRSCAHILLNARGVAITWDTSLTRACCHRHLLFQSINLDFLSWDSSTDNDWENDIQ